MRYLKEYCTILKNELILSAGCTEPVAIGVCAALVRELLNGVLPEHIDIACSMNIYKNVKSVSIPHSTHLKGVLASAVLGLAVGDSHFGMQIFNQLTPEKLTLAEKLYDIPDYCSLSVSDTKDLNIRIKGYAGEHTAVAEISEKHTNIVMTEVDGEVIMNEVEKTQKNLEQYKTLNFSDILDFTDHVPLELIRDLIQLQIKNNWAIASDFVDKQQALQLGHVFLNKKSGDIQNKMIAYTCAASEARMSGCQYPVCINAGSGNQGITVSVPLIVYARENQIEEEKLMRALLLSNLLNLYQKFHIGELSSYCGISSASASVAGALTYLKGGSSEQIQMAIRNHFAGISGMLCDGAKTSCALKILCGLECAFCACESAMNELAYDNNVGIIQSNIDETIKMIGSIAQEGMSHIDQILMKSKLT